MIVLDAPQNIIYDVCIIGSGPSGAAPAFELANAGYSVIVLEKGPYIAREDFSKDELAISRRKAFSSNLSEQFHTVHYKKDGKTTIYKGSWDFWNGSLVGGSSHFMSGFFHRLKPDDFRLLSRYGEIEGANVADWPISYDDLEPFYELVEREVGVSGEVIKHQFSSPRSTANFPFNKLAENPLTKRFDAACKKLNITPLPTPRAILSEPAHNRDACYYSHFCGGYPCSSGAKGSGAALLDRCNAFVVPNAFVYRLESSEKNVKAAHYFDENHVSNSVKARIFILAAQPVESARLLLNSANKYFPNGLANSSSQVGKNLIFSAGGVGGGTFYLKDLSPNDASGLTTRGLFFNRNIQDFYELNSGDGASRIKGGLIDFLFEHPNLISNITKNFYEAGELVWGEKLMRKIEQNAYKSRRLTFEVFNDWLPTDGTFVWVNKNERDIFGVAVAQICLDPHPMDLRIGEILSQKAVQILEKMGAKDIKYSVSSAPPPNLQAGGARFGDDPAKSVLNKECCTHDLDNLYITDASFMPTGGSVPYTWTIYANAFRVAKIIKSHLKTV